MAFKITTNRIRISIFGGKYSNIRIYSNIRLNTDAHTERYLKSSIPYMQSLLNKEDRMLKNLVNYSNANTYASELCHNDSITTENLT